MRSDLTSKKILSNLKSTTGVITIFSDEKTFTVDPVFNRQNDQVVSFGEVSDEHRYMTTTKHPASVICDDAGPSFIQSEGHGPSLVPDIQVDRG